MRRIKYYLPGTALILSGILIAVFPEILVALLASIVIMAGIGAIFIGKHMSESEMNLEDRFRNGFNDDYFEDNWNSKKPFFRYYRRWF